jgi:ribosomal protein S18 acetylase RimI-like enzyme
MLTMEHEMRLCDAERDLAAVQRMWEECGWVEPGNEREANALRHFLEVGHATVGVIAGEAECLVHRTPGTVRYDETDLSLCAITAVTTSAIARNAGLASTLTASAIAEAAAEGAAVAALGMFEQGFYDRFGLGTCSYDHQLTFDPSALRVDRPSRAPVRLTRDDWSEVHAAMVGRARSHGAVCLDPPGLLRAELGWVDDTFLGLGFRDDTGRLTHLLIGANKEESGPCKFDWVAYQDGDQLLELLGLIRSLGTQLHEVTLDLEPAGIQLQDVLDHPIRDTDSRNERRRGSHRSLAWWQLRILDLEACVAARSWLGEVVDFDLTLTDPLSDRALAWPGLAGEHTISVG